MVQRICSYLREDAMNPFFLMCFLFLSNIAAGLAVFLLWERRFAVDAAFSAFARRARLGGAACAALGALAVPAAGLFGDMACPALLSLLLGILLFASGRVKAIAPLAAIAALVCILAQGAVLVPVFDGRASSLGTVAGAVPLALLLCGSLAMGAELCQWRGGRNAAPAFTWPLRLALWGQLLILALVPCAGENADPALQFMGLYWMDTQLYWAGVLSTGVTIGLTHMDRATAVFQSMLVFFCMFCVRISIAGLYFLVH